MTKKKTEVVVEEVTVEVVEEAAPKKKRKKDKGVNKAEVPARETVKLSSGATVRGVVEGDSITTDAGVTYAL